VIVILIYHRHKPIDLNLSFIKNNWITYNKQLLICLICALKKLCDWKQAENIWTNKIYTYQRLLSVPLPEWCIHTHRGSALPNYDLLFLFRPYKMYQPHIAAVCALCWSHLKWATILYSPWNMYHRTSQGIWYCYSK
jgi:hypothetical protein